MGGDLRENSTAMSGTSGTKKKGLLILLVGLTLLVWYFALFGEKGVVKIIQLRRERDRILSEVRWIQQENKRLKDEVRRLREDPNYLESVARRDLGLIKENEILFIFEDEGVDE